MSHSLPPEHNYRLMSSKRPRTEKCAMAGNRQPSMTTAAGLEANGFHSNFAPPQALFLNSTKNTFITFFLRHLAISVLIGAAAHQNLPAQPANEPLEKFVAVDGQVTAIAKTNNVLYFGGQFDVVGVRTGSG